MATIYNSSSKYGNPQVEYHPSNRMRNQIVVSAYTNFSAKDPGMQNSIFCLEQIQAASAVTVKDGDGNIVLESITTGDFEMSPIRCNNGIEVVGTVTLLKGFILEDVIKG